MIAHIGLATVIELSITEPEQVRSAWLTVNVIVEALGGDNEIVGGLWVLLLSIAALKSNNLSKKLNSLDAVVGLAGVSTVYHAEALIEIFGLSQIVWFSCLGIIVLLTPPNSSNITEPISMG